MTEHLPPLLAITGPTASGKSALALALAEELGAEIVTADSRQVYKLMDIGTEKPSLEEQARVPHHMIDLVYPDEPYTLALYQREAYATINDVLNRGKLPILAGGTPLYVNAVLEGWTIPEVEPDLVLRGRLEAEAEAHGPQMLHRRLAQLDADAAAGILPSNTRRIVRALEVIERTGRPISAQQDKVPPPYRILSIVLHCQRPELYRRIDSRVDRQIERGLVGEVAGLHARGYGFDLPSMSGIGYRQIGEYLMGRATLEQAAQRMKWDTHAFARHQGNWFRRARTAVQLDVTEADPLPQVRQVVRSFLDAA
ncbi:MAG: tRNA (adenosine(37)-N6)-dimethylallyltransferase MiaA [Chloroflexota bacterium]|nr:tRNA (adenosine(37)-N6)-dimethylallyltransferase MiaA [Chloroflexota bacterium]